jgi:hypothetical protein
LDSGGPAPTGTVQFVDVTTGLPVGLPQTLPETSTDSVLVTVDNLSIGTHDIVASYLGDATYPAADSAPQAQDVLPPPPVISKFTPKDGPVGQKVTIFGSNLASASRVALGVTQVHVLTDTSTEITVRVPHGAHTGTIQVTAPGGTATSTKMFRVKP